MQRLPYLGASPICPQLRCLLGRRRPWRGAPRGSYGRLANGLTPHHLSMVSSGLNPFQSQQWESCKTTTMEQWIWRCDWQSQPEVPVSPLEFGWISWKTDSPASYLPSCSCILGCTHIWTKAAVISSDETMRGLSIFLCNGQVECLRGAGPLKGPQRPVRYKVPRWSTKKNRLVVLYSRKKCILLTELNLCSPIFEENLPGCAIFELSCLAGRVWRPAWFTHMESGHGVQSSSPSSPDLWTSNWNNISARNIPLSISKDTAFLLCHWNCRFVKEMAHPTLHADLSGLLPFPSWA